MAQLHTGDFRERDILKNLVLYERAERPTTSSCKTERYIGRRKGIKGNTVRTGIIEPHARTLELPFLVGSGSFFFFSCLKHGLRESIFAVRSTPYPREGIDVFARSSIIPVLTVIRKTGEEKIHENRIAYLINRSGDDMGEKVNTAVQTCTTSNLD